jgi:hypothetical protein
MLLIVFSVLPVDKTTRLVAVSGNEESTSSPSLSQLLS